MVHFSLPDSGAVWEYLAYKRVAFDTALDFHLKTWFEGQRLRDQA